jgi:hypothetical protein
MGVFVFAKIDRGLLCEAFFGTLCGTAGCLAALSSAGRPFPAPVSLLSTAALMFALLYFEFAWMRRRFVRGKKKV